MILRDHHEALEWDLLNLSAPIDLLDFWRGTLSIRRLQLAIRFLPESSALVRSIDPDRSLIAQYGTTDYVLMNLYDLLLIASPGVKGDRYTRPDQAVAEAKRREERNQMLEEQAARIRAREAAEGGDV